MARLIVKVCSTRVSLEELLEEELLERVLELDESSDEEMVDELSCEELGDEEMLSDEELSDDEEAPHPVKVVMAMRTPRMNSGFRMKDPFLQDSYEDNEISYHRVFTKKKRH